MKRRIDLAWSQVWARLLFLGGLSRHGIIASARLVRSAPLPSKAARVAWVIPASTLIGIGVAFLLAADLGVGPLDVLLSAIDEHTVLSHGQAAWVISGSLFVVAAIFGVRPTFVGLTFVMLNGVAVDLARPLVVGSDALGTRVAMATLGITLITAGVGTIVHTSATGGSFEAIMAAAERRGWSASTTRTFLELSVLSSGIVAGGAFGPVTIVMALTIGPAIKLTLQALADHREGRTARLHDRPGATARR